VIRGIVATIEIAFLSALILATRSANYEDVFVAGNIYFVDADCYARMTRVTKCAEKPGLIVRHHDFENFPQGTTPHTTAPFDYLILGLSLPLKLFTTQPLDVAGAWISPLLALITGWFLWWWSRRMGFRYRWVLLTLYAISPILVHGTALGRPDHQSLLILLVTIAICAEWSSQNLQAHCFPNSLNWDDGPGSANLTEGKLKTSAACPAVDAIRESRIASRRRLWSITSAVAWAMAIWVSAYEPLMLFLIVAGTGFVLNHWVLFGQDRRAGWVSFVAIIVIALLIEQRVPSIAIFQSNPSFKNWAHTISELAHVSPANPVWLRWCGFLLLVAPFLIWMNIGARKAGAPGGRALPVYMLLIVTYFLTIWQARWGYFFVLIFALALPALLAPFKARAAVWTVFFLSIFPILRDWDSRLWANEEQLMSRMEKRIESAQIRELAFSLRSSELQPFLAPWWLSPAIVYWSGQPGVAGSSHESLNGIEDSARFFLSEDLQRAREILQKRRVAWVFAYDSERVAQNASAIMNERVPPYPLCRVLDRTPSQAPPFLMFFAQNAACKLYREKTFHSEKRIR
jgi:hypothetical protein